MSNKHFKSLENMFYAAPINKLMKPTIQVKDGKCEIKMDVDSQFFHAANALHGSVYFKLLDDAAFFAANSIVDDVFVVTGSFEIKFLRPILGGKLLAVGEMTKNLGNKLEARANLFDEEGNLMGSGSGVFVKTKIELTSIESYKN
ncbi:MAG: PaaI family thioesterase [Flavobacteriales bacterium]|nr:PaaI family thioesterase [Flavobacteriales bacterium]MCB9175018.1 PaaI family thioesterase [Flavobacteriales bacterium]